MAKWPTLRIASLTILLVFVAGLFIPATPAKANLLVTYRWPYWWSGAAGTNDCNSSYYNANNGNGPDAVLFTTWRGIQVCGPRPQQGGVDVAEQIPNADYISNPPPPGYYYTAQMFECTELATRYLRIAFGLKGIAVGGGGNFANAYATEYPGTFQHFYNGIDSVMVQEGDVVSFTSNDPNGHVAIASQVTIDSPGNGTITFINQNGSPAESPAGTFQLTVSGYTINDNGVFYPTDWVHPIWNDTSPAPTVSVVINDSTASGPNDVWLAGTAQTGAIQASTWHYDGTQWTRYLAPFLDSHRNHHIKGIDSTQDGDVWAVGDWNNYGTNLTLAYHWDEIYHRWVVVPSANPNSNGNYLYDVAIAGTTPYAIGSSNFQPMLLKWNGISFAPETLALPPGSSSMGLAAIDFSSANNGWIVGNTTVSGNGKWLAYHFDGAAWTATVGTTSSSWLSKVIVISDTEAWALGTKGSPAATMLLHYTTANGWSEVFVPSYPEYQFMKNYAFNGLTVDTSSNVWLAGWRQVTVGGSLLATGSPALMYYNGTSWTYSYPAAQLFSNVRTIVSAGDNIWTAGTYLNCYNCTPSNLLILGK